MSPLRHLLALSLRIVKAACVTAVSVIRAKEACCVYGLFVRTDEAKME